ncbi:NUDIX domain-containing protein [Salinibacter altiplanensis]|uniref:NUDIX domain-containing protein n=1 Tax=Salinibacter altiplanensis TaxID=1803181 RepID=UPI000C9F6BF5|nr:NUDIX domain-containing protein [Salinibacter altiplanensis]
MPTVHLLSRAVVRDANHVLVVRADGHPHTFLPGGHREPGEGLEACLRRELREELGVRAEVGRYLGAVEHQWRRDGERQYEVNHCYVATSPALTVDAAPQAREEYLSFSWAPVDQLERASLQPPPLRALLAGKDTRDTPWWGSTVR